MKWLEKLKILWAIAGSYTGDLGRIRGEIIRLQETMNERTTVHADIHHKRPSLVIVVGEYKGHDYVRAFQVTAESFPELIQILRGLEGRARVGRMDINPMIHFSALYPHERL